ncbi:putative tRNA adenosine deaminase-associated protein [Spinactinospora alkalitolerans]|uniref:Putative tRNA adenosine deaminase-associated protein n=1 Tax=Spinactinospora alkalitolerans TaxID=687207 RepID=A0A852U6Y6_9ACTN|nr:tRNA adenosine deaminase-associated protein [Spinactinospora alkalitolerans]NYE50633.1 putative tRNA adenosine deaminase-associated protein [Spinactinospora alkalitolerans]
MSIFSAVFSRSAAGWTGAEIDLAEADGIDDVADLMRDVAGARDPGAAEGTMILMVEADDEWFGIVRVDDHNDPQVFLSDARVVPGYPLAALLLDGKGDGEPEEAEGTGQTPYPDPAGDSGLLSDFGTSGEELLALTLREGLLPADALDEVAGRAGFAESLDALRA